VAALTCAETQLIGQKSLTDLVNDTVTDCAGRPGWFARETVADFLLLSMDKC
jgi:hypothetical protein